MTNQETLEALDWCRNFQDNLITCRQLYDPRFTYALNAMRIAIDALEKADKYQWHDLRKNPDDLPKPMSRNIFVFANWNEHCRHEYGILDVGLDGRWCDGLSYLDDVDVIAWKYCDLVPFEVEE